MKQQSYVIKKVWNRRNKFRDDNKGLIDLQIYFPLTRKRIFKSTNIWVKKNAFIESGINSREPNYEIFNIQIEKMIKNIQDFYFECVSKDYPFDFDVLKDYLNNKHISTVTFNQFCWEEVEKCDVTQGTIRDNKQTFRLLDEFNPKIEMRMIDRKFINNFSIFIGDRGYTINTLWKHHKTIKKFIHRAMSYELLDRNPYNAGKGFQKVIIKRQKKNRWALPIVSLDKIAALNNLTGQTKLVRDMFLISCACALRFSDLVNLRKENVRIVENEKVFIDLTMHKTDKCLGIEVKWGYDPGKDILIEYFNKCKSGRLFPNVPNPVANRILKFIQAKAELNDLKTPLVFHLSRHSCLTLVAINTGNVYKVMVQGGISKSETAQVYVDMAQVYDS